MGMMNVNPTRLGGTKPSPGEEPVTIYNLGYEAGTLLFVLGTTYQLPAKGQPFQIKRRHLRNLVSKHGKNGKLSPRPANQMVNPASYSPPPGYKLVRIDEETNTVQPEEKPMGASAPDPELPIEEAQVPDDIMSQFEEDELEQMLAGLEEDESDEE